jgi:FHS family Na+ dependent glucose MFS transporter 1
MMATSSDHEAQKRRARTAAYYLGYFGVGLMDSSLGPTLAWLAQHASIAVEDAGVLFAARSCGYIFGSVLAGRIFDRVPGHRIMAAGLLCTAVAFTPIPRLTSLVALIVAFVFAGAGSGALDVGGNTLLAWIHGDRAGPFLNGLHFFFGVGSLVAPAFIAQAFARGVGLAWVYWAIAALFVIFAAVVAALPSPPRRVAPPLAPGQSAHRDRRLVVLVAGSLMAYVGMELGFGGWIFTYATLTRAMSAPNAAYLTSAFWGAFTLGRLTSIPAMAHLTRRHEKTHGNVAAPARAVHLVLDTALAGAAAAVVVLLLSNGERGVWIGSALLGLSIGPIFPTLIAVAEQRLKLSGQMTSLFLVGAGLGGVFIPWLVGLAMQRFGTGVLLPAVGASLGLLVVFYAAVTASLKISHPPRSAAE